MLLLCREEFEAGRGKKEEVVNPNIEVVKKEVVVEEFDRICHETLEDLEIPDAVQVEIGRASCRERVSSPV